jgi:preprotein translocase subunit SecD
VAIGITADSFVEFFERIKDEVHEGRSIRVAVPRAWVRARRTILSADTVSFLAAAVLYEFASSDVKGFAFTLGLSTILDLIVVFLFTHPLISLLSRSRAFGSARFTGLNAVREGGIANYDPEDAPARRTRPARTTTGTRTAAPALEAEPTSERFAGVAVLDRPGAKATEVDEAEELDEATEPDVVDAEPDEGTDADAGEDGVDEDVETEADDGADDEAAEDEPTPRRRTTPEPGSAAERAAARRAKLRADREKGGR